MARGDSSVNSRPTGTDPLDEIFDYDANIDDILDAVNDRDRSSNTNPQTHTAGLGDGTSSRPGEALGIDEEITVAKARKPIAKLDETRLTSAAGIPKLQKISKTRLKFRGKGHEFSDVALLLRTYQLWLDDLYPRAKFADGLAIVEKLGHKKSMQRLRSEWINENQPKVSVPSDSEPENLSATPANPGSEMVLAGANQGETNISPDSNTGVLSDAEVTERAQTNGEELSDSALGIPDEDELDQLLADEDTLGRNSFNPALASTELPSHTQEDDAFADDGFDDEEDMMRDLGVW